MLALYSIVFTAHSSLQKRAMHTKKSVCIVTTITLNLVHTKNFSVGKHTELVGNYTIISGIAHWVSVKIH